MLSCLTSFPVVADKMHPQNMMLPPPCFTEGLLFSRFLLNVMPCVEVKKFDFGLLRPENLFPHVCSVSSMHFVKFQTGFHMTSYEIMEKLREGILAQSTVDKYFSSVLLFILS